MTGGRERILIESLELSAHLGITDDERAVPQRVTLALKLEPHASFAEMGDDLARTVDYVAVCDAARVIALQRPRQLLETLAQEIADGLCDRFPIRALELELRKYVVPKTAFVAVALERENRSE